MHILFYIFVFAFANSFLYAQLSPVESTVYQWSDLEIVKEATRERRQVLKGMTTDLAHLEIHASTLQPGKAPHPGHTHNDKEELVIVTKGNLKVTINDQSSVIGPGSIALIMPGDYHGFENGGDESVTYYVFLYQSKLPIDIDRGKLAGGSFVIDRNDVAFTQHGKGGVRRYFDKSTAMFSRFEMHVTTLNAGLKSHEPHTHRAEEVILLVEGNSKMQIDNDQLAASAGALIFLGSQIPHAIQNTGDAPCEYFAFQWQ